MFSKSIDDGTGVLLYIKIADGDALESKEQQESHHKTEQTHGFGKGESQDGV